MMQSWKRLHSNEKKRLRKVAAYRLKRMVTRHAIYSPSKSRNKITIRAVLAHGFFRPYFSATASTSACQNVDLLFPALNGIFLFFLTYLTRILIYLRFIIFFGT